MTNKLDKKSIICLGIIIIVGLICAGLIYYFSQIPEIEEIKIEKKPLPAQKIWEKVVEDLTVPEGAKKEPLPETVIKDLTVPKKANPNPKPLPKEVIENLTAPK